MTGESASTAPVRRLVTLRHAKSDWPEGVADGDRPLADRGRRDAVAVGQWLHAAGIRPDVVVVSPARRARDTWSLAAESLGAPAHVSVDERVYAASTDDLLTVVRATDDSVQTLLLVGHAPSMEQLVLVLQDGAGFAGDLARLSAKYPTSGLAVLDVPVATWSEVDEGGARLVAFATPRG